MTTIASPDSTDTTTPAARQRSCPLCGRSSTDSRLVIASTDGAVRRCRACDMMFLESAQAETEFEHTPDYIGNFLTNHQRMLDEKLPAAHRCLDQLPADTQSVLEIGLGVGALAAAARERGLSYHAVEPSGALVDAVIQKGIVTAGQVHQSPIEDVNLTGRNYDAVVMIMVLEHLIDPVRALQQCLRALRPGGVLYLEVPNSRLFASRTRLRRVLSMSDFVEGHVNFFVPDTLTRACRQAGAADVQTQLVSLFRRDDVVHTARLNPAAATPLRLLNAFFSRLPVDEWLGIASVLCCMARRGEDDVTDAPPVTEAGRHATVGDLG